MSAAQIINSQLGYKPFMDGLRAVAIVIVVAYHVGLGAIPGGFVGVDVFFVISGYLISTHLISSLSNSEFSFGEFWARRALRILPSYLLVIAACMVVAPWVLVLPGEFSEFGKQVTYSSAMLANHYFLGVQGYFDGSADVKPLLHLWSLAVEEQFYLIAPIILFLFYRVGSYLSLVSARRLAWFGIGSIFLLSLYGCIQLSGETTEKNYAFFLTVLRAWEFIFGGVIAFLVPLARRLHRSVLEILAIVGVGLIVSAAFTYSGADPYPSTKAFFPVLGAALVILCGIAEAKTVVARALAIRPMVWIGLVSYAWYLWHWPLLAFGRIFNFGERHLVFDLGMAFVSLLLAWLTYIFVDRAVLTWRKQLVSGLSWKHAGRVVAFCVPVGLFGVMFSTVVSPSIARNATEVQESKAYRSAGVCNLHTAQSGMGCVSEAEGRTLGLLIGDSHAGASYMRIAEHANTQGAHLATLTVGGCAAVFDVLITSPNLERQRQCQNGRMNALRILEAGEVRPKFAILVSRWDLYAPNRHTTVDIRHVGGDVFLDFRAGFISKMKGTIEYLQSVGVDRILIIGPVPTFATRAPECVRRSDKYRIDRDIHCAVTRESVESSRADVTQWLKEAVTGYQQVNFIDPIDLFCDDVVCRSYAGDSVLYRDTNHISNAGLDRIYESYSDTFRWLFSNVATD